LLQLNDCILCRIYLKREKQKAEAKKTGKKSRNDGNTVSHGPADSRNDASTSYNYNSQQPANHAAFTSDTMEVYFNGIQPYDSNMNQCCYGDNSNQIAAMMEPAMYTLPNSIEGTGRGSSQRVAFAVPSSSMPLTMNVAGLNGPSSSMPLTMHGAGFMRGPNSSMPLTMHGAGFMRGPNSLMPLTMHAAGLNEPNSTMHLPGLNGPNFSMPLTMHGAGLNGSSMPLTMLDARLNGPSSSIPLTMHGAGLNGPNSSMMHGARLNGPNSSMMHGAGLNGSKYSSMMHGARLNGPNSSMMHGAGLNGPNSSTPLTMHAAGLNEPANSSMPLTMHAAGLNGPISSMPPTTLPIDNMEGNDHLVEPNNDIQFNNHQELNDDLRYSLPDSAFRDDAMARIHEMWVSSNSRREG